MPMTENLHAGGTTHRVPGETEYLNVLDMHVWAHLFSPVLGSSALEPRDLVISRLQAGTVAV